MYSIQILKGENCPNKVLILKNYIPICFTNSKARANELISYLLGNDDVVFNDKSIQKILDKYKV